MTIRLLIAEGDPASARMLEASLVRYGFDVTHAHDGEAAVAQFTPRAFDVVLLDVSLPRKSGIEAAKAIRTKPGGNQVGLVLTSANTVSPEVVLELKRAQVDAWFNKPLSMRDLRDKLAELAHKYTGATSELLHVETGRKALAKATARPKPPSGAVAKAQIAAALSSSAAAGTGSPSPSSSPSSPSPPSSSSPGFAAPPPTSSDRVVIPRGPPLTAEPRPVDDVHASARMMLSLARARATGVYTLTHKGAEAKVAFIQGVMVGAMDSSTENRLLSRLARRGVLDDGDIDEVLAYSRDHKLRAAEAVLALEHCDAETLLDELEQQARARLVAAAGWRGGDMRLVDDKAEVARLAISRFDAYEIIFRRFDHLSDPVMVSAWIERAADDEIKASRDFEDGLVAYARVSPKSPLPSILFSRPPSLEAVLTQIEQWAPMERDKLLGHVYGMWVAGLLRLPGDDTDDERAVPRPVRADDEVERAVPDKEACALVRAEWLRAQGRSYYDVLGVANDADQATVWGALASYRERFGKDTLGKRQIAPVVGLAEELWALVEDIETTLLDAEQRAFYDASLAEQEEPTSLELSIDADSAFLEGKLALSKGDMRGAKECFERAVSYAPENVDFKSYLAWTELLEGAALVETALGSLKDAAAAEPDNMRPMLLVGLAHERLGRLDEARAAFEEAERREPGNAEVESALRRVRRDDP